jgi:putative acetyltransferase
MTLTIRSELVKDAVAIRAVHEASFPTPAEAELVDALRAAGRLSVSLVAEAEGLPVGHVAFSPVTAGPALGMGLAPLAVLPAYRRHGIGAGLVREGLATCARAGIGFVVVLGSPRYYGRFGFAPASDRGLSDEFGGGAAFQVRELSPGAVLAGAGLVRYAPEFAVFLPSE